MLRTCVLLLLLNLLAVQAVPRPMKVAALFDHNTNMRHDVMFVNAIKATPSQRSMRIDYYSECLK